MADITLDVFNGDAFNTLSLTDAINAVPFVPGRAGTIVQWEEEPISTTAVLIEEKNGELQILDPTPRGGPGSTSLESGRNARSLIVPHYEHNDFLLADSVQNVRAFGQANVLETVTDRVNRRLSEHVRLKHDPTLEFQRVGALKGIIVNGSGSTLYNLFTEFGVTQETEIDFDLDAATPAPGVLRKTCAQIVRKIATNLGGTSMGGVSALCGDDFFDALIAHPEVVESYKGTPMASVLRDGYITPNGVVYGVFEFGGIIWENYRGSHVVSGTATPFIGTDKCHIFPTGVPGLYRTVYAPADWEETVNTPGLPRYAKQYPTPNGKGRHLDSQMNALSYCTRPKVLMKGKRT